MSASDRDPSDSSGAPGASRSGSSLRRALDPIFRGSVAGIEVGPWVLEEELARGAVGAVFRARHRNGLGQPVALKVLLAGEGSSETQRKRLLREAQALARLGHPHVVRVHDAGESEGFPWLAMELIDGVTLAEHGPRGPRELARLLAEAARGLEQAHARGIVHRDLKPANIMVRRDGAAVVTDFGLARESDAAALTRSGSLIGTPGYMAPEQALGGEVTPASDVHSLGVILYEGLTGLLPWRGESMVELLNKLQHERPAPPSRVAKGVPPGLERVCLRALEHEPTRRYADAGAFAADLEAWLRGEPQSTGGRSRAGLLAGTILFLGAAGASWLIARGRLPEPVAPAPSPPASASGPHTLRLQPGPVAGKDATIRSDGLYLNDNFGPAPFLRVGDRGDSHHRGDFRSLIQLPLPALPAGARLRRATLGLWLVSQGSPRPLRLVVSRVVESGDGRTPWVEGTGLYDEEVDGVCWDGDARGLNERVSGTARSGRPELSQPDAEPVPVTTLEVPPQAGEVRLDVTAAVQAWLGGAPDHGLRLAHEPEGEPREDGMWDFASSDAAATGRRPWLELEWEGPALPPEAEADPEAAGQAQAEALLAQAAAADRARARPLLDAAARAGPQLAAVYLARARLWLAQAQPGPARVQLQLARGAASPVAPGLIDLAWGEAAWLGRDPTGALESLEKALRVRPEDLRVRAFLGQVLVEAGAADEALRVLEPVREAPDLPWLGHSARGQALLAQGRADEAEEAFRAGVEAERRAQLYPGGRDAEPALALMVLLRRRGETDQARALLRACQDQGMEDPRLEEALRALAGE